MDTRPYIHTVTQASETNNMEAVRRRIQGQMNGLDVSARKVQGRIRVLERFLTRFRKAG